jgi:hypothetical protein
MISFTSIVLKPAELITSLKKMKKAGKEEKSWSLRYIYIYTHTLSASVYGSGRDAATGRRNMGPCDGIRRNRC